LAKKLYVGNLPYSTTDDQLKDLFSSYGTVSEAIVISDRNTGRSKGFGFVTIDEDGGADKAVETLNGSDFESRQLVVNEARPKEERRDGGRFGRDRF